jgi:hypothetical protein
MPRLAIAPLFTTVAATAAQPPELDQAPGSICAITKSADEWIPTQDEVMALEKALPIYFGKLRLKNSQLPAEGHRYARQYIGITRNGVKLIYGRFYPASDDLAAKAKSGQCWEVSDGGNLYWSVVFKPTTRLFISFTVNGVAERPGG